MAPASHLYHLKKLKIKKGVRTPLTPHRIMLKTAYGEIAPFLSTVYVALPLEWAAVIVMLLIVPVLTVRVTPAEALYPYAGRFVVVADAVGVSANNAWAAV
jgi:hypothetical protein